MAQKKTTKRRKLASEINVVPYIDVMLVLLVVFMITAPMMTAGVKVDLPDANAKPIELPKDEEFIIVSVDQAGQYYLSVGGDTKQPKPMEEVAKMVGAIKRNKPATPVLMEGDHNAAYGLVVQMMVALQEVGVNDVGLVTESEKPRKEP
ncbi:MAG TPA: protein TolR [Dongiaceae bacterium]|nr:protein TolR [Dongiaceae bacterium]